MNFITRMLGRVEGFEVATLSFAGAPQELWTLCLTLLRTLLRPHTISVFIYFFTPQQPGADIPWFPRLDIYFCVRIPQPDGPVMAARYKPVPVCRKRNA